jgi:septation ring formation regulator EzrA
MEEALVNIEITSQEEKVKQEERRINILSERLKECDTEMEKCLDQQAESQQHFRMASDKYTSIIKTFVS